MPASGGGGGGIFWGCKFMTPDLHLPVTFNPEYFHPPPPLGVVPGGNCLRKYVLRKNSGGEGGLFSLVHCWSTTRAVGRFSNYDGRGSENVTIETDEFAYFQTSSQLFQLNVICR